MAGKLTGITGPAKFVIGTAIALVIWAIMGVGIGLFELFNATTTGIPATVLSMAQTLTAVGASIAVVVKFFD